MKKSYIQTCVFFVCALYWLGGTQAVSAQATLSIQGIIQKSNGAAVDDGNYDLTFKLYPNLSGGSPVHTETQNVSVIGGIYSAELGGGGTPLSAAFDQTYYLGVSVDGGAELVPRTRLTSSPYALSLLGTENLFSSAGSVGIGTTTPHTSYKLHVRNASGGGRLLLEGTNESLLTFKKGNALANIGILGGNDNFVFNPGVNNTVFQHNGTTKLTVHSDGVDVAGTLNATTITGGFANMAITSKLAVGQSSVDANNILKVQGTSLLNGYVRISGTAQNLAVGQNYVHGATQGIGIASGNWAFLLNIEGRAIAAEFWAYSDRRLKKDFRLSEGLADLNALRQLRVTDYRHIDIFEKGSDFKKGFVAQEVQKVFPEAVTSASGFIPNVYAMSEKTQLHAGKITIALGKNHEFSVGDEVKLILKDGSEKMTRVVAVTNENTFVADWTEGTSTDQVFVFGKKVSDLNTVDYDRIFTLNVSATQELARKVELLEKENAALKSENKEMKASVEKFDARLRALENKHSN